ncbi:MAG: amidophosphoribosyltransferase [Candidatus Coatesbacteria bacterium]|nr:MAG: amidophosphoribosyltransferase [Candidatus Coatesbacteria bacterium]
MIDEIQHDCGIIAVLGHPEAANLVYLGLYALQHRGQESCGIVSRRDQRMRVAKGMGLVADVFDQAKLDQLVGDSALGHVRYSTTGSSRLENAQPILVDCAKGSVAVAHNGNLVNSLEVRAELESRGSIFQSTSDSETIVHLIAKSRMASFEDAVVDALSKVRGSYSLIAMNQDMLVAARDPRGFRPLVLGTLGDGYVIASETCAFDLIGAKYSREVEPGELIVIGGGELRNYFPFPPRRKARCVFELIYFARPDSLVFSKPTHIVRKQFGAKLADEAGVSGDIVIPVPDSGICAAIGFSERSGIFREKGFTRNHYVGRTFIEPKQSIRYFGVKLKLNPIRDAVAGKRVIVIDDSIVRGTTSKKIIDMLREAGAKTIHYAVTSPPYKHPCMYGIDTPTEEELIANQHSVEEIRKFIGADTLSYLSMKGLLSVLGEDAKGYCTACFSGKYPVVHKSSKVSQFDLFRFPSINIR